VSRSCTGDHIFAPAVELLVAAGVDVSVVSRARALSSALARSVSGRIRLLPDVIRAPAA
jgi:hypothetical protein